MKNELAKIASKTKWGMLKHFPGLTKLTGRRGLVLQKYSPEILIGLGITGIVVSTVMACKATLELEDIIVEGEEAIADVKQAEQDEQDPAVNYKKELSFVYIHTASELVKLYGPSALLGATSVACIVGSHHIMKSRNLALIAAYKTIEQGFNNYRQRVIDEFGEEKDHHYRYGITEEIVNEIEKDENGKSKKVKKAIESADPNMFSQYAKFFDEGCANWSKNPEYNLAFLKCQQTYANDMLHARGHLFLNEVYDLLGIDHTGAGAVVGWVIDEDGDNFVDFGIYGLNNPSSRRFVNGAERSILLDFNVNGVIYDKI